MKEDLQAKQCACVHEQVIVKHEIQANCCVVTGPSGTGFIRNNGVALLKQDETGSVSAGASAGVSDDQYADSGMHANGGYHQTSRFGRSAPLLHERMQSTNSSTPIHREYDGGVDEEQSLTSDTQ